ncbi:sigma-70 family RNA polymerase sigma factor, partial [Aduncisulcus paluster]
LLHSEAAIGQRITRAKNKIRTANIPLRVPPAELLPERTPHVLSCIYSVFTEGYWSTGGPSAIRDELCDEGVRLAGELCKLMPQEREANALAALVLLHDSRRLERMGGDGALVPLEEQDRTRWDRDRISRGLGQLRQAAGSAGPYLPQAKGLAALEKVAHDPRLTRSNLVATVRADLLRRAGRHTEAIDWYRTALSANGSDPGREFLRRRIAECETSLR